MKKFLFLYGTPLLAFFLPFERIGAYEWRGITIRLSQVLLLLLLIIWMGRGVAERKLFFPKNPFFFLLLLFLWVNMVSTLSSPHPARSWVVFFFIIFTTSLLWFLPILLQKRKVFIVLVKMLLVSTFLVSVFGLYQFLGDYFLNLPPEWTGLRSLYTKSVLGFPRVQSTALEPLYFANFLFLPLSLCLTLFLSDQKEISKKILLPLMIVIFMNFFLTIARGAYLALIPALLLILCFSFRQFFTWKNILGLSLIFVLALAITVRVLGVGAWEKVYAHTVNILSGASYNERRTTFALAKQMFHEHPWFGSGPGSFGPWIAAHPVIPPDHGWKIVNNEYLELLAENGVLGLALFLIVMALIFLRTLWAWLRASDPFIRALLLGMAGALLGILVQYNTFSVLYIMHVWFVIGALVSLQNYVFYVHED